MITDDAPTGIDILDVRKSFGSHPVLDGVSLSITPGTTTCIIGASGSGKSTLLRCINGLESIDGGSIFVGERVVGGTEKELNSLRADVGMVFQQFNLFPHLTAIDNIALALRRVRGMAKAEARERALEQLERVSLGAFASRRPASLSGGQQQRVAIARALAIKPKVMLFDEATSALDPELVKGVLGIMQELSQDGMTMVVVTHEMQFARDVAHQVAFLDHGKLDELGSPTSIFEAPESPRLQQFLDKVV